MRTALAAILLLAASGPAFADDSIRITFQSGECIGCSAERSEIYISRPIGPGPIQLIDLDRFFALILRSLHEADMPLSWHLVPAIHSDEVRVDILMGGKRYSFSSGYENGRVQGSVGESLADQRRRHALEDILRQTAEYAARRYRSNKSE